MTIKKSKEEWVKEDESVAIKIKRSAIQDLKVPFAVRVPESLYRELKNYLENYGRRGESINEMFIVGVQNELQKRLAKAGDFSLDNETKINNIISDLTNAINDLQNLQTIKL